MNPEHLEALLTDRALGELPPEVAALLAAYLAQNPAAATRAAGLETTLRLARTAVATPREKPASLDLDRLRREQQAARFYSWGAHALRLAASLAVGVGVGWLLHPEVKAPPSAVVASVVRFVPPQAPVTATTNFWSVTRFAPEPIPTQPGKSL